MIVTVGAESQAFAQVIYDHDPAPPGNASADAGDGYARLLRYFLNARSVPRPSAEKKLIVLATG